MQALLVALSYSYAESVLVSGDKPRFFPTPTLSWSEKTARAMS